MSLPKLYSLTRYVGPAGPKSPTRPLRPGPPTPVDGLGDLIPVQHCFGRNKNPFYTLHKKKKRKEGVFPLKLLR